MNLTNLSNITGFVDLVRTVNAEVNDFLPSAICATIILIVYVYLYRIYQKPITTAFVSTVICLPIVLIFGVLNFFSGYSIFSYLLFMTLIGGLAYYFEK